LQNTFDELKNRKAEKVKRSNGKIKRSKAGNTLAPHFVHMLENLHAASYNSYSESYGELRSESAYKIDDAQPVRGLVLRTVHTIVARAR
jgi:hypothetical protein